MISPPSPISELVTHGSYHPNGTAKNPWFSLRNPQLRPGWRGSRLGKSRRGQPGIGLGVCQTCWSTGMAEKVLRGTRNKSGKQVQQIIICQIAGKQVAWKNVRINFEIDDSLSLCQTSPSFCPAAPCISATCGETVQSATRPFSVTWSDVDAVNVSFGASGRWKTRKIRNVESWKAIKTKCGDHKFSSCHQVFLWNTKNWYMLCLNIPNHVFVKAVWWLTVL